MKRLLLLSCAIALAWCDHESQTNRRLPTAPSPVSPTISSFEIAGNTNLTTVNETSQFNAIARFSDGTSRDVTTVTFWRSVNPAVATVSRTGLVTAIAPGRSAIAAEYERRLSSRDISVLPSGTFVLKGRVIEAGDLPLSSARIEIVDGAQRGRSTQSTPAGDYDLYGVAGQLTVTASKEDYVPETRTITVTDNRVLDFELQPRVAHAPIAGTYRLTFTASAACAMSLPDDVRTRSYRAVIAQRGARFDVELLEATFAVNPRDNRGRAFSGRIQGNTLSFTIGDFYYGYFEDLVEQLGPTSYLSINGYSMGAVATPSEISGTLRGPISVWDAPNGFYGSMRRRTSQCSSDHPFVFKAQ